VGYQTDLLAGLAQRLAAAGVGTWSPTGSYTAEQTGIVIGTVPGSPDRIITLTGYGVDDSPSLSDSVMGVQVITRTGGSDPRPTDDLADQVFDQLHGLTGVHLPSGIRLVQCLRQSHTPLGQDGNRRWSRSDNYYLSAHRPSPHRI
jgi:hypothetical protein